MASYWVLCVTDMPACIAHANNIVTALTFARTMI